MSSLDTPAAAATAARPFPPRRSRSWGARTGNPLQRRRCPSTARRCRPDRPRAGESSLNRAQTPWRPGSCGDHRQYNISYDLLLSVTINYFSRAPVAIIGNVLHHCDTQIQIGTRERRALVLSRQMRQRAHVVGAAKRLAHA